MNDNKNGNINTDGRVADPFSKKIDLGNSSSSITDINIINKIVHGHIHNYNDMTLVHGHLHNNTSNDSSNDFKRFEFINMNESSGKLPSTFQSSLFDEHEGTSSSNTLEAGPTNVITPKSPVSMTKQQNDANLEMLMEECDCNPQIIEICCENDKHDHIKQSEQARATGFNSSELVDSKKDFSNLPSNNPTLEQIQKDLLFLNDCNVENKEISKDVVMNFLDITKMYDIPILSRTHGKIVEQENLLKTGLPNRSVKSNIPSQLELDNSNVPLQHHHHHKLEIHSHGMHAHNSNDTVSQSKPHVLDCEHDFDCQPTIKPEVKQESQKENFLEFNWNEKISSSDSSLIDCRWDGCGKKFKTTMELQSHLIIDHLGNGDCKHSKKNSDPSESHKHSIEHSHSPPSYSEKELEEECFWDSCHFETSNVCDLLEHINSTHGINFNMSVKCNNPPGMDFNGEFSNGLPLKREHSHRHNIVQLPVAKANVCQWGNCQETFSCARELDIHLREHLPKRLPNYECQWKGCEKHFKQRQKLERHMKSHSCYKGFQCPACNKYFSTADILLQHKRKVHNQVINKSRDFEHAAVFS